jgi:NADH-quinone oxidoreductase subunit F
MSRNKTIALKDIKNKYNEANQKYKKRIIICAGTGCVASGALKVHEKLVNELESRDIKVDVKLDYEDCDDNSFLLSKSGCQGFCEVGPLLRIYPDEIFYTEVGIEDVEEIIERTLVNDETIDRLLYEHPVKKKKARTINEIPFYEMQDRLVLGNCGTSDAEDIEEYIAKDGYLGAQRAYTEMSAREVCQEMKAANLRGRGGGGFPAGIKWDIARQQNDDKKYIICNGDEGDPGAFMDRSILEGNPHSVIEGLMIGARAMGADQGYIYVRIEYPLAVKRMRKAINDARELGLLGNNIFESGLDFDIEVMEGAGAFVCGEETALIKSIEGHRGMPQPKPPYTAEKGLWDKPTIINNVETLATVPVIIRKGVYNFKKVGTSNSPGTKTFALTGNVANTGLIEVPFGTTLREIVFEIGGGVLNEEGEVDNDAFKAVQIGGPSGGCLTEEHLDLPMDFDSLDDAGAMVGSGGLVVMNQSTCMVSIAKFFMEFTQEESCGKCVLCREGTKQMLRMLDQITEGKGYPEILKRMKELGKAISKGSLCGLGKTASNPVLSTMEFFADEYAAHVKNKVCPTNKCKALSIPEIDPELCKGCTLCAQKCPVDAISGKPGELHRIEGSACINCGTCIEVCKFNAIK